MPMLSLEIDVSMRHIGDPLPEDIRRVLTSIVDEQARSFDEPVEVFGFRLRNINLTFLRDTLDLHTMDGPRQIVMRSEGRYILTGEVIGLASRKDNDPDAPSNPPIDADKETILPPRVTVVTRTSKKVIQRKKRRKPRML